MNELDWFSGLGFTVVAVLHCEWRRFPDRIVQGHLIKEAAEFSGLEE
jgi:hypothetical protein